jgi:hypothetical protein
MKLAVSLLLFTVLRLAANVVRALDYHAEYSIAATQYQSHFDEWAGEGYRLVLVTGYEDGSGTVRYNTIWHKNTNGMTWLSYHGMTESSYQTNFNTQTQNGFVPVFVDGFSVTSPASGSLTPRINVIYAKQANPPDFTARHGQTSAQYQQHFEDSTAIGYDLDIVSTYQLDGNQRYASLFSRFTNNNAWEARHGMTSASYQTVFDELVGEEGCALEYVSAGTIDGNDPRFSALFVKANGQPSFRAYHGVSDVQAKFDEVIPLGYIPKVIDAYQTQGGSVRWALLFTLEHLGPCLDSDSCGTQGDHYMMHMNMLGICVVRCVSSSSIPFMMSFFGFQCGSTCS